LNPNQPLNFTVQRDNKTIQGSVVPVPVTSSEVGSAGWHPDEPVIVGDIEPGLPADKIGIKPADKIIALDGQPVPSIQVMIERLQQTKSKPVQLTVDRNGKILTFTATPVLAPTNGESHYRLGFRNMPEVKVSRLPLPQAFSHSLKDNERFSVILLQLVGKLVQHKVSLKTVSGPIGIAQQAGEAAQEKGWTPLLALTAAISLNLGIFNLLPIPIMDGGVILLLFIESLMGRDISLPIKERIYQAAFVFLVLFAAVVIYNDIVKTMAQRLP
jgi:regulator of sigma E protease